MTNGPCFGGDEAFYETVLDDDIYHTTFARLIDPRVRIKTHRGRGRWPPDRIGALYLHAHNWRAEDVTYSGSICRSIRARHGVGRKLIEAVYHAADDNGTPTVYWNTQHFNETARQLYDRIGQLTPFIKYQR